MNSPPPPSPPEPGRLGPELISAGDESLLSLGRRAVLLSRTPRRPAPGTAWVRATVEAVQRSVRGGEALVTGLGRAPYEVALAACRRAQGAAVVVLEQAPEAEFDKLYGDLLPARRLLVWPVQPLPPGPSFRPDSLTRRDRTIGALSDRAWAIYVRPDGHMAELADALRARGCPVEDCGAGTAMTEAEEAVGPSETLRAPVLGPWKFVAHYTREPDGPWPDESIGAYADWLAHGPLDGRRDALDALRRILAQRSILGSGRLMPFREKMVSFTARSPADLASLMQWRRGLHRWTFRPYGIAVEQQALFALGARPVEYLTEQELRRLPPRERLFAQRHAPPATDWSAEAEWRLRGALRLDALPPASVKVLVPSKAEAEALESQFGWEVWTIAE